MSIATLRLSISTPRRPFSSTHIHEPADEATIGREEIEHYRSRRWHLHGREDDGLVAAPRELHSGSEGQTNVDFLPDL